MMTGILYFSPLLLSVFSNVSTVDMYCTCHKKNKQRSYGKRKVRWLFWQEIAYLENHDVTLGRTGPSCDWAGTATPWSSVTTVSLRGTPRSAGGWLKIWKKAWGVRFHDTNNSVEDNSEKYAHISKKQKQKTREPRLEHRWM